VLLSKYIKENNMNPKDGPLLDLSIVLAGTAYKRMQEKNEELKNVRRLWSGLHFM
jgi:hypothetical protein